MALGGRSQVYEVGDLFLKREAKTEAKKVLQLYAASAMIDHSLSHGFLIKE